MQVACQYLPANEHGQYHRSPRPPDPATLPIITLDSKLHLLHLELLYSYTEDTSLTLPPSPVLQDFWKISVPRIALEHEYVMRSLLAVSALHTAHRRPDQRTFYVSTALEFHQRASQNARILLQDITSEHGVGLFLFSVFTVLIGWSI